MPGDGGDRDATAKAFGEAVNMTPARLEDWLGTDASREVGQKGRGQKGGGQKGGGESVGHASGRRVVGLLRTKKADLDEDDLAHMREAVGYVHRHLAQRPDGDVTDTPWRYSHMNWGHDPLE
ncbi:DUF3140 domain-containing protein [Streptomyces sp. NPDC058330]|uniref:DUF3140 domain-containing protein n=1 Tax=Streptomyces sp. NPDC058330 TaxID=3346449 RepID=UPI0036E9CD7D